MSYPEFSRTLSLLRQERGVSQRVAAGDLGITQAVLSHYENGYREPGLAFVVKACEYYHVSADFLLGRTLARDGGAMTAEDLLDMNDQDNVLRGSVMATLQSKLISGAVGVLFELLGKLNSKAIVNEAAGVLGTCIYQLYRRLYRAAGGNEAMFGADAASEALGAADAERKLAEARYVRALAAVKKQGAEFPELSSEALLRDFPGRGQSMAQVLHNVDIHLEELMGDR